jgi:RimJ/RimL family protein N-acetyltransferase
MTPSRDPGGVLLETDRLTLRRFADTAADADLLFDLDSDPEVLRYVGPGHATAGEYRDKIRTQFLPSYAAHPHRGFFAAVGRPAGDFLGWFLLRPAPDYRFAAEAGWDRATGAVEVGYRLRRAAWGRGLATEGAAALVRLALADPAVACVVAAALVTNRASWRVMEKCGMARVREFAAPGFADPAVTYAVCRPGCSPPGA